MNTQYLFLPSRNSSPLPSRFLRWERGRGEGFILPLTLIFLQLITLLGLYALQSGWLEYEISELEWKKYSTLNDLESILYKIEEVAQDQIPSCVVPLISDTELSHEPLSWWESQSCTGNFRHIQYYYVFESLGSDLCAMVRGTRGQIADYYKLTLVGIVDNNKILLQSTFIKSTVSDEHCQAAQHQVMAGQQTIRRINV